MILPNRLVYMFLSFLGFYNSFYCIDVYLMFNPQDLLWQIRSMLYIMLQLKPKKPTSHCIALSILRRHIVHFKSMIVLRDFTKMNALKFYKLPLYGLLMDSN